MKKMLFFPIAACAISACTGEQDGRSTVRSETNSSTEGAAMASPDPLTDAQPAGSTGPEFAAAAAAVDGFAIQSSQLALQKSLDPAVKQFARGIISEHGKSAARLKAATHQAGITIAPLPQLDMEQQANLIELKNATGAEFDKLYLEQQMGAQRKAQAMVQAYAQEGDVPSLKDHAASAAGPIGTHLEQLRKMLGDEPR